MSPTSGGQFRTMVDTMEIEKPSRRRRNHTEEFKQAVITACCEAGASVAGIALANIGYCLFVGAGLADTLDRTASGNWNP